MSIPEREIINKIIEDNLETTKNTKMPFFWAAFLLICYLGLDPLLSIYSILVLYNSYFEDELRSSSISFSFASFVTLTDS
jgi:hypothetical protein